MKNLFAIAMFCLFLFPSLTNAQYVPTDSTGLDTQPTTSELRAVITNIELDETVDDVRHVVFNATDSNGKNYHIDSADSYTAGIFFDLKENQKILLQAITYPDGTSDVFLIDVIRTHALFWIFILFAIITIAIGTLRGASALVGLFITIAMLFGYIIPQIAGGANPVIVTVLGGIVILAVNMHITHGFNRKTFISFMGTVAGLALVVIFSKLFVVFSSLSGMASDESVLLLLTAENISIPSGILLAGIILGAVGVLDDIAVTQVETVSELKSANPEMSNRDLFKSAMHVGRHHIASLVNTLVLAYAGVALPLFLLFYLTPDMDIVRFINEELIAEEFVRTLAGTTGLVLLVPISTWLAIFPEQYLNKKKKKA